MPKKSFKKGWKFERRIAEKLRTWGGEGFERSAGSGNSKRTKAIADLNRPTWFRRPIECKDSRQWTWKQVLLRTGNWWDWWNKLQAEAPGGILVFTGYREPDYVAVDFRLGMKLGKDHNLECLALIGKVSIYLLDDVLSMTDPEWWKL